jgi:uncharacterized protein (TIRG00374 family)
MHRHRNTHSLRNSTQGGRSDNPIAAAPERWQFTSLFGWLSGLLLLVGLVLVTLHFTELERFAVLLQTSRPSWLLAAVFLQVGTYLCAARILQRSLAQCGVHQRLAQLVPLSLAKLFTDQAVPSIGLSGTLLMIRGLERRGVSRGISVGAMLTGWVAHYIAYGLLVAVAIFLLWWHRELTRYVLSVATLFGIVAAAVPIAIFWLRGRAIRRLPDWMLRLPPFREALAALSEAPFGQKSERCLIAELTLYQVIVFLLDVGTLGVALLAMAAPTEPGIVLASFIVASVTATLGWIPGGVGTFDATCVAMLHWHGVPLEAAFAATLLLRGLTFWLPMIPGLWLAHRELHGADTSATTQDF